MAVTKFLRRVYGADSWLSRTQPREPTVGRLREPTVGPRTRGPTVAPVHCCKRLPTACSMILPPQTGALTTAGH